MGLLGGIARGIGEIAGEAKKIQQSDEWIDKWKEQFDADAEKREKIYQTFVNGEKERYFQRKAEYEIKKVWEPIMKQEEGSRDFSPLDELAPEYRQSDFLKMVIEALKEKYYKVAVDKYFDDIYGLNVMLYTLPDLLYFEEINEEVKYSLKHFNYFVKEWNDISSVLTNCEDIGKELEKIRNDFDIYSKFIQEELLNFEQEIKTLYNQENYMQAFNRAVNADKDVEFFDNVKRALLSVAMQASDSYESTTLYEKIRNINDAIFKPIRAQINDVGDAKAIHIKTVDMMIAETLKYAKANVVDNINTQLTQFLQDFGKSADIDTEQYEVLRKVFAYLKAYKQEAMVLEAMVVNNVPRSMQQEKRLAFLKSDISKMDYPTHDLQSEIETNENQLVYEYKCLSWNANEIKAYFDMLSSEDRTATIPLVIDEWNKSLELENVEWNNEKLSTYLAERLKEHFGERFVMNAIESGAAIGDWIDFAPSVLITEKEKGIYPWVGFVITGEQLTLAQITFSIYAIYLPENDFVQEENALQKNSKMASKVSTLKLKQNPKINNYFNTVNNVLVSELENWINDSKTQDIYN